MQHRDMTQGRPLPLLLRFALPLALGNALQLLYTLADSWVVGRLIGPMAYAAVGAAGFFYWLVLSVTLGLSQGFSVLVGQRFGARDAALGRSIGMSWLLSLGLGALLTLVSALCCGPVLHLLNTPPAIYPDTHRYLMTLFCGLIISFAYNALGGTLRALGDSVTPLAALICATLLNISLDVALVLHTALGVMAVALATLISQVFACAVCLMRLRRLPEGRLTRRDFRPDASTLKALLRLGGPMGFRNFVIALGGMAIQYFVNGYDVLFIAGVAAARRVYGLLEVAGGAMEGAIATFVAQNFGAGRMDRIDQGIAVTRRALLISAGAVIALLWPLGRPVLVFISGGLTGDVIDVAERQLRVMLCLLPSLYLLFLYRASLQGVGNALHPMLSGFVELFARLVSVLLLPLFFGQWGVLISEAAGWPVAGLQLCLAWACVRGRRPRTQRPASSSI